jgi:transposase
MDDPPSPPLPFDVATLQGMVRELLATVADLRKTVEAQQHRLDDLTRRLYGRKSERVAEAPTSPGDAPAPLVAPSPDRPARRCGHGRRPLPGHLLRERVEYDLAEAEKACPCCGKARVRIGAETSEQLDYRPASLFVIQRVRHTYACTVCSRTADPADDPVPTIATAPLPVQPIDKGLPGPGLLAHVVVSKFADHLPLYRQVGILARHGVDLSPSTLGGWVAAAADLLRPIVVRMAELVRQSRVIQTDDTPVPVLDPGSRRTKIGHLWVYLGDADRPYAVFDFTPTYSGDGPKRWLGDYDGYVQADALKQYDGRKNYLFAGSDGGGRSAAVLYSVVGTCRRVGLDPFAYLRDVLTRLPSLPVDRLDELLPARRAAGPDSS